MKDNKFVNSLFQISTLFLFFVNQSITIFGFSKYKAASVLIEWINRFIYLLIIAWLVYFIVDLILKKESLKKHSVFLWFFGSLSLTAFSFFISFVLFAKNFSGISSVVNYSKNFLLLFLVFTYIFLSAMTKRYSKYVVLSYLIVSLLLSSIILLTYASGISRVFINQSKKQLLTLNYGNSNTAGLLICLLILSHFFIFFKLPKKKWARITFLAYAITMLLFLFYLLILTKCRNAYIGLVLCGLTFLLLNVAKSEHGKFIVFSFLILPIVLASAYTILFSGSSILDVLSALFSGKGKPLTSRGNNWSVAFAFLSKSILFGNYNDAYSYSSITHNFSLVGFQNSQLDWIILYGFIPAILLILSLYFVIKPKLGNNKYDMYRLFIISCWMINIFTSMFETGYFLSISGIFIFSFMNLGLLENNVIPYESREIVI